MIADSTVEPTDAEILDAAEDFRSQYMHGSTTFDEFDEIGFARAVLAKWGAPTPASSKSAAVLASGPVGFDHKTAVNFPNGKAVTDDEIRLFVAHSRWAHDDRDWLRNTIADLRREIAQRDAEIALLKTSLLDAEAPQPAAQAQEDAKDAARYRFLRNGEWRDTELEPFIRLQLNALWDSKIDAAIAEFYKDGPGPEFRAHYERLMHISAAIAAAPAQAQVDAPDMFWDADDTENFAHEIQDIVDGYGPGEIVTIECAKRMPSLRVLITGEDDNLAYEHIDAAIAAQKENHD